MITQCTTRNIHVISFSGDGDTRLLQSMRLSTQLYSYSSESIPVTLTSPFSEQLSKSIPPHWIKSKWFAINAISNISPVQDTVHLGVKLKARLMSNSQVLALGNFSALSAHLLLLHSSFRKEQHNLRLKDLDHQDRQNFEAVIRLTSPNVTSLLDEFPDALGTKYYLLVVKNIVDSFLRKDLSPLQRIQDAWFALFFVRYWRQWILCSKQHTLERHFITANAYICIELNAHALITFLLAVQNLQSEHDIINCYFPWLLGSQPCERAFRTVRSMSSIFSTIINFSLKGLLQRLHKLQSFIELQSESDYTGIIYPQKKAHSHKDGAGTEELLYCSVDSITTDQIETAVKAGFTRAQKAMTELGMKELLIESKQWEYAFGDIGELVQDDDDELPVEECAVDEDEASTESDLAREIETLQKKNVITQSKMKFTPICKQHNSSNNSTIPIYKVSDKSKKKQSFKKDHKFVEIIHNNESIFVRKSTLVWLHQEGERVSSDRLFRVRSKQPYNTMLQNASSHNKDSQLPKTEDQVSLGDFCVFKNRSDMWKIGKVLQFANFNERLKKDRQYKNSQATVQSAVGALCSWYHSTRENNRLFVYAPTDNPGYISLCSSYVCTLFCSCFEEVQGTNITGTQLGNLQPGSSLNTACEMLINERAFDCISTKIADLQLSETIVISDDNTPSTSKGKVKTNKIWVICNGYRLYHQNKQQLLSGKELNDMHINGTCSLIKQQYPEIGGMQLTVWQQSNRPLMNRKNAIQILHINKNHWAVISTIGCEENSVNYYDSLSTTIASSTKRIIVKLLQPDDSMTVQIKNVAEQFGGTECGLYALAYCVSLAVGEDPCERVYDQREMRPHLISCIESKNLTTFPISKKRSRLQTKHTQLVITICPTCKDIDTGSLMVYCEECKRWYHQECVPPFDEDDDRCDWICPNCLTANGNRDDAELSLSNKLLTTI